MKTDNIEHYDFIIRNTKPFRLPEHYSLLATSVAHGASPDRVRLAIYGVVDLGSTYSPTELGHDTVVAFKGLKIAAVELESWWFNQWWTIYVAHESHNLLKYLDRLKGIHPFAGRLAEAVTQMDALGLLK